MCIAANCSWSFVYCVIIFYVPLFPHVLFYNEVIAVLHTLVAGLLARSQYPEGPKTGHLGTGFSWLRWFPRYQVATACFSHSPPNLNFLNSHFKFMLFLFHIYVHAQ